MSDLTFGQQLTGVKFNPSKDPKVDRVKELCAELADIVHNNSGPNDGYLYNLIKGKALGEILTAQMLAVKLLTLER